MLYSICKATYLLKEFMSALSIARRNHCARLSLLICVTRTNSKSKRGHLVFVAAIQCRLVN